MGFRVVPGQHLFAAHGYFAGTDEQRLADLNTMLADPQLQAIWFARGGYGTTRLLNRVRWAALTRHPKTLIGYSDLTALFARALRRKEQVCLHGPLVTELDEPSAFHGSSLRAALAGETIELPLPRRGVLHPGRAAGRLLGGNLTVLVHLLGTRYFPDLRNAVLFLEDVGEPAYRLDRSLTQLAMSGRLSGVRAILVGSFEPAPRDGSRRNDRPVRDLLTETFVPLGVPVVTGLRAGHVLHQRTLPLGGRAVVNTGTGRLRIEPVRAGR